MDVTCAKCQEPFDVYHLMHDAIHETDLPEAVLKQWRSKLTPVFEEALNREGWRFVGHSLLAIAQCPACKEEPDTPEARERAEKRGVLAELLGDDLDGLACHLEDLDLQERGGRQ
jgi:hypothetical protein